MFGLGSLISATMGSPQAEKQNSSSAACSSTWSNGLCPECTSGITAWYVANIGILLHLACHTRAYNYTAHGACAHGTVRMEN